MRARDLESAGRSLKLTIVFFEFMTVPRILKMSLEFPLLPSLPPSATIDFLREFLTGTLAILMRTLAFTLACDDKEETAS